MVFVTKVETNNLEQALTYINDMWGALTREQPQDHETLIALPKPYVVPSSQLSDGFMFDEMYYWDNLFIIAGLLASDKLELAKGIVDNEVSLIERFGLAPNASRYYMLGRSQPPTLTMQAWLIYEETNDLDWFERTLAAAENEYHRVWLSTKHPHNRQVWQGLSRYYDTNAINDLAECESGWDYTTRFNNHCLDYLPIDLNAFLWRYEHDFAELAKLMGDKKLCEEWRAKAAKRQQAIDDWLWDDKRKFYFDFDYKRQRHSDVWSLAAYVPLFVGMVTHERAQQLADKLDRFETRHGLTTTGLADAPAEGKQWAAPNGWAPLHYMVVKGLETYGLNDPAEAIAHKWLATCLERFERTGHFYEKYNVIDPEAHVKDGVYPDQVGFGWTNGVFAAFARDYS